MPAAIEPALELLERVAHQLEPRSLLDVVHALGYLNGTEYAAIREGAVDVETPPGASEVASWLLAHGWLDLAALVRVCGELDQPLVACDACRIAWWCEPRVAAIPERCGLCAGPAPPVTSMPRLGLVATPLPTGRLRVAAAGERPRGFLGVLLALHYQLIPPRVARDYLARDAASDSAVAARLFEDGRLSRAAFEFLEHRLHDVAAGGLAPVRTPSTPLAELCRAGGYLGRDPAVRLRDVELDPDEPPGPMRDRRELGAIQLLYNLGEVTYYQAVDLLERHGLDLDRCLSCGRHWRVATDAPRAPCTACGRPVIRLAGRCDEVELAVAPLALRRWAIEDASVPIADRPPAAAADPARSRGSAGASGALVFEVTTPRVPPATKVSDEDVESWLVRLHLLDPEEVAAARRIARDNDALLLRVLGGLGFVSAGAIAYLRRRLRIDPSAPAGEASLIELACRAGYLPPAVRALEDAGDLEDLQALRVLEAAYNGGRLALWQLIDLLERRRVHLEHCCCCAHDIVFPRGASGAGRCPVCGSSTVAIHDPTWPDASLRAPAAALPSIAALRIVTVPECEVRLAARDAGSFEPSAPSVDGDERIVQLIHRYRLVPANRLTLDLRELEGCGGELDLEDWLFHEGRIDATMLTFLAHHREVPRHDPGRGTPGHCLVQAALARGALSLRRYHDLYGQGDAPDPERADAVELALDLERRAALAPYQVIDLLEATGIVLLHCGRCSCQIAPVGALPPAEEYACPHCGHRMLWLTPHPHRPGRVDRIPPNLELRVRRCDGASLLATTGPADAGRVARLASATPPLIELLLEPAVRDPEASAPGLSFTNHPPAEPAGSARLREHRARAIATALASRRRPPRTTTRPASAAIAPRIPDSSRAPRNRELAPDARGIAPVWVVVALVALAAGIAGTALPSLLAPRPLPPSDSIGPAEAGPPRLPTPGESVVAWGLVVSSRTRSGGACRDLLVRVDVDHELWVRAASDAAQSAVARVVEWLEDDTTSVLVRVEGVVRRGDDGAPYLEATELYRAHPPLPASRWISR